MYCIAKVKVVPSNEPMRKVISFTRLGEIECKAPPSIIDGYLFENTVVSLVGKSGTYKSFIAQSICAAVATGTPWLGRRVQQGAVFYLAGEGRLSLRKRFDGWSKFHGIPLDTAPIFIGSSLPTLCDMGNVAAVIAEVAGEAEKLFFAAGCLEPKIIVVDTFARAMAGFEENSAADVGLLMEGLSRLASRWPSCVIPIHHTGHADGAQARGRGSSAFYAGLDGEYLVTKEGAGAKLHSTKEKDWRAPMDLYFDRHVVDVEVSDDDSDSTTLVLAKSDGTDTREPALQLRAEICRLKANGISLRNIAGELGITKSKVEHELRMAQQTAAYQDASDGV